MGTRLFWTDLLEAPAWGPGEEWSGKFSSTPLLAPGSSCTEPDQLVPSTSLHLCAAPNTLDAFIYSLLIFLGHFYMQAVLSNVSGLFHSNFKNCWKLATCGFSFFTLRGWSSVRCVHTVVPESTLVAGQLADWRRPSTIGSAPGLVSSGVGFLCARGETEGGLTPTRAQPGANSVSPASS